jgi:hypothetical protein
LPKPSLAIDLKKQKILPSNDNFWEVWKRHVHSGNREFSLKEPPGR